MSVPLTSEDIMITNFILLFIDSHKNVGRSVASSFYSQKGRITRGFPARRVESSTQGVLAWGYSLFVKTPHRFLKTCEVLHDT